MIPQALPAARDGETGRQLLERFRRPSLPAGVAYALLLREPARPTAKPLAFASLGDLARSLHQRRDGGGLQLIDTELTVQEGGEPRRGVSIWTLDAASGDRRRYLGWAWLRGAGRLSLEAALQAEQPGPVH